MKQSGEESQVSRATRGWTEAGTIRDTARVCGDERDMGCSEKSRGCAEGLSPISDVRPQLVGGQLPSSAPRRLAEARDRLSLAVKATSVTAGEQTG